MPENSHNCGIRCINIDFDEKGKKHDRTKNLDFSSPLKILGMLNFVMGKIHFGPVYVLSIIIKTKPIQRPFVVLRDRKVNLQMTNIVLQCFGYIIATAKAI